MSYCINFLKSNFNHTISFPLQQQTGLQDFKVSLFKEIDLPRITPSISSVITDVAVELSSSSPMPKLQIGVDESYTLEVTTNSISIKAVTVYGARHAFETLLQLIRISSNKFVISQLPIKISDAPRFKWRGLMVDPSRNPLSPLMFKRIIDTLASVKANVLHIHLSDAQTFVFESKKYPLLHQKGMYDQSFVLTQSFLKELTQYGANRGVIVYGEIDTPAHTASWNLGYPGVVANCWDYIVSTSMRYGENVLSLNPANPNTFPIIDALMKELSDTFDTDYVHVGGDEVWTSGWSKSKEYSDIQKFMKSKGLNSLTELEGYFNKYAQEQVIHNGKHPVVWEEVFKKGNADKNTIVQVWDDIRLLQQVVNSGYKAIFSAGFYLDKQMPLCNSYDSSTCVNTHSMWVWTNRDMYDNDPVKSLSSSEKENVLGGEGCSWGESTDEQNFFDRVFQRYSAIAERLWSKESVVDKESHEVRANYLRCLDVRRDIMKGTGPLYHSFCQLPKEKRIKTNPFIFVFFDKLNQQIRLTKIITKNKIIKQKIFKKK
ncbi:hypothetical protein ENUP19_0274G0045 [Entamoeba nuttalli]|uniref:Beta-hexosaminidase n=1 Tax=Entamoeba nuttalli TaxID=412467 RepID=A0ABQ0DT71_9EUKA